MHIKEIDRVWMIGTWPNGGIGVWFKGAAASQLQLTDTGSVSLLSPELSFAPEGTPNIGIYVKFLGF